MAASPTAELRVCLARLAKNANPIVRSALGDLPVLLDRYLEATEARLTLLDPIGPLIAKAEELIATAEREGMLGEHKAPQHADR